MGPGEPMESNKRICRFLQHPKAGCMIKVGGPMGSSCEQAD